MTAPQLTYIVLVILFAAALRFLVWAIKLYFKAKVDLMRKKRIERLRKEGIRKAHLNYPTTLGSYDSKDHE